MAGRRPIAHQTLLVDEHRSHRLKRVAACALVRGRLCDVRHLAVGASAHRRLLAHRARLPPHLHCLLPVTVLEQEGGHSALAFDVTLTKGDQLVTGLVPVRRHVGRHLDAHREGERLHARRGVNGVPQEAVARALGPDDARKRGPAVHADADAQALAIGGSDVAHNVDHGLGHRYHALGGRAFASFCLILVVPRCHHVRVANRLHLVDGKAVSELVKGVEHVGEHEEHLSCWQLGGQVGEADNV
mmetsp:Transcript_14395/g.35713  ORF Transcript_14395/g.35713 Transcript_14395/m.35713 type:complete len:244 (-) Transcript_14395:1470-2201(-)